MAIDEQQDWVDRVLARSAWEPSAHFTNRVIVHSMASVPRRVSFRERMAATFDGVGDSLRTRLEGSAWVIRQYRDLLLHS